MLFWSKKGIENDRVCLHLLSQKNWTLKLILDDFPGFFIFSKTEKLYITTFLSKTLDIP